MLVVYKGIDCIRWLLNIKAPLLIVLGLLLLYWAYRNAGGFGPITAVCHGWNETSRAVHGTYAAN